MTTYKVWRCKMALVDEGTPAECRKLVRDTIATGLTWEQAKAMRQRERGLLIMPERAVVPAAQTEERA